MGVAGSVLTVSSYVLALPASFGVADHGVADICFEYLELARQDRLGLRWWVPVGDTSEGSSCFSMGPLTPGRPVDLLECLSVPSLLEGEHSHRTAPPDLAVVEDDVFVGVPVVPQEDPDVMSHGHVPSRVVLGAFSLVFVSTLLSKLMDPHAHRAAADACPGREPIRAADSGVEQRRRVLQHPGHQRVVDRQCSTNSSLKA